MTMLRETLALGEGSFRMMVSRDRDDGRLTGESGMKDDQYPYRVLFSTLLTRASRQFRAAWRTRPWLILQERGRRKGKERTEGEKKESLRMAVQGDIKNQKSHLSFADRDARVM